MDFTVSIECTKDGVSFKCQGDIGSGSIQLRSHTDVDKPDNNIEIDLTEPVSLTFSLKYLVNFCKASGLSNHVKLCLSNEVPLLVEYRLPENSYLRFYLAPKVWRLMPSLQAQMLMTADWRRGVSKQRRRCYLRIELYVFRIPRVATPARVPVFVCIEAFFGPISRRSSRPCFCGVQNSSPRCFEGSSDQDAPPTSDRRAIIRYQIAEKSPSHIPFPLRYQSLSLRVFAFSSIFTAHSVC